MHPVLKKLKSKEDRILFQRCDEILHYIWDPLGCKDIPMARDEYYGYLPQLYKLLINGADRVKVSDYLKNIEKASMGMTPNNEHILSIAELLIETREAIYE